ncbi:MAG: methylenetetrahydrofolate reductase [NAD(P)H] [Pseudomonadota bacterium]|nr:methylenetetrahydrofolate reductase [NAD(P)H] [Pseudomonadota bacterium]MDE3036994.1 methylenetetrahydrofolate reductase [NAD(P)H] [Pseudomonadota bacterium]
MTVNVPALSFEFFPPKTAEMEKKLWDAVLALSPLSPHFVSVTYGAGGTTRSRTHATVKRIAQETSLKPAAHLTCVGAAREEVAAVARGYWEVGVRHVVALRGDPPQGAAGGYAPHPGGYRYGCDLVAGLKRVADFEISVAAFPEKHPESASFEADIEYLRKKIDAGATRAITQYFFEPEYYFRLLERARSAGIAIPIVPGILPIANFAQMKKFSAMCGASIPLWLEEAFAGLDDNPEKQNEVAVRVASELCQKLLAGGATHLHFYTLNRADLTTAVCKNLR